MSYLALARKFRPRKFEEVIGQGPVVTALTHALSSDRLHPAILLTGTRGVGKTTLARILAKGLNCEKGVSADPCQECTACKEVDEGRFIDLLEIDAASHTGVDNVREVIDNAQYAPSRGRYKVYLVDEVHMLSRSAFNALLKTLEEPPPHVKFVLATTDPQKLPVTVLSRCLQFNLRRLSAGAIRDQLLQVLEQEGLKAENAAAAELARAADGSLRDGLSLLDQAIAFCGGGLIALDPVREMLGTQGREVLYDILGAVAEGDAAALQECIRTLDARAPDYGAMLSDLAGALQRIAVLQMLPGAADEEDEDQAKALAASLPMEDVQLYYQIVISGRRDLPWAPDPRMGFEMCLLRLLGFRPDETPESTQTVSRKAAPAAKSTTSRSAPSTASKATAPATEGRGQGQGWSQRVEVLGLEGYTKQLARHCVWKGHKEGQVQLGLDGAMSHLLTEERRLGLEQALQKKMGKPVALVVTVESEAAETPARVEKAQAAARQQGAEAAIENDPTVQDLQKKFGAKVRSGSVQPLDSEGERS